MANRDLTQGPVWKALAIMSAPMSFGIFAVLSVGIADAYFLGRLGGAPLAAVGYIYPVTAAIASLAIGLSAGANATLSQALGRGEDDEQVRRLGLHAIGLGLVLSLGVAVLVWAVSGWLFPLMGASGATMDEVSLYIPWWAASFPFLVLMMVTNAAFRAHGDSVTASVIMVLSAAINVALTPALVFGWQFAPEMGTAGAAAATWASRVIACAAVIWIAWRRGMLGWCGSLFTGLGASLRSILEVGLPAAFSNAINPAGMAMVTAAVATLSETAVAGFGAATRVQSVALVPLLALSSGIGPVIGQNWGAEQQSRARLALAQASGFCVAYGLVIAALLTIFADPIARWIASGEQDAAFTAQYLRWVSWSFMGYGVLVVTNAAMNARSRAVWSMGLGLARVFALYLPLAWIGVSLAGFPGVLAAAVTANLLAIWGASIAARATELLSINWAVLTIPLRLLSRKPV